MVLSADGYILTNNHVVADADGGTVQVIFANGKTADGQDRRHRPEDRPGRGQGRRASAT